jgi:hypothetical protein
MRTYTTMSPALSKSMRSTRYTLARQMAAKYFPANPLAGTYAVLDTVNATVDGQVTIPLTVNNGI